MLRIFGARDVTYGNLAHIIIEFCAGARTSGHDHNHLCILAVRSNKFHLLCKPFPYGIHQRDTVVAGPAAAAILQAYLYLSLSIPHRYLATFCLLFMFISLAIMIRCAWGEPAPCMDSVR